MEAHKGYSSREGENSKNGGAIEGCNVGEGRFIGRKFLLTKVKMKRLIKK